MKLYKNKKIVVGVVVGILLLVSIVVISGGRKNQETKEPEELLPTESVIPTVGSDVNVDLISSSAGHEVTLVIKGIPSGTNSIDYELSYQTAQQGLQGVIGTIELSEGEVEVDKNLTLGTCSSGTCIYHKVVGKVRLNLRFSGDDGEKVFENEFEV